MVAHMVRCCVQYLGEITRVAITRFGTTNEALATEMWSPGNVQPIPAEEPTTIRSEMTSGVSFGMSPMTTTYVSPRMHSG